MKANERDIERAIAMGDFSHCENEIEYWAAVEDYALGIVCDCEGN